MLVRIGLDIKPPILIPRPISDGPKFKVKEMDDPHP